MAKTADSLLFPHFLPVSLERETKEAKQGLKWRAVLSSGRCFFYWSWPSLLPLSLLTAGRSKLDCFRPRWLTSAFSEEPCFQIRCNISSSLKWFLFFSLLPPRLRDRLFKMTQFLECTLRLSWQVTSVKLNNLQCNVTTLSTLKQTAETNRRKRPNAASVS